MLSARHLFDEMSERGIHSDITTCTAFMRCAVTQGDFGWCARFWTEMSWRRCKHGVERICLFSGANSYEGSLDMLSRWVFILITRTLCEMVNTYPALVQLQADHRSQNAIEGKYDKPLFTREHKVHLSFDPRYEKYVRKAGLYGIHRIGRIPTDHSLITALAERWRQETHTFHFPVGEMTVTLQDAAVLLGLRVDGKALCLRTNRNWKAVVRSLLGRVDNTTFRSKSRVAINMSWLSDHFGHCPEDANEITVQRHARAYLLYLVGSLLFTDHSGDSISAIYLPLFEDFEEAGKYSWASGVLAFLYKELCLATRPKRKQFGGSVILLQLWSWERLPFGRPITRKNAERPQLGGEDPDQWPPLGYIWSGYKQFADIVTCRVVGSYREEIDALKDENVIWLPYENKMHLLPPICNDKPHLWRTTAPLFHYWIVEMYNPGRVARQFNRYQVVPPSLCDTMEELHKKKNGKGKDWVDVHQKYVRAWGEREEKCLVDQTPYDHSQRAEYMRWFSGASILFLQTPGGAPDTSSSAERFRKIALSIVERYRDVVDLEMRAFARDLLHECKAGIRDLRESVDGDDNIFSALDEEPIEEPMEEQIEEHIDEQMEEPIEESFEEQIKESMEEQMEESNEEQMEESMEEPIVGPVHNDGPGPSSRPAAKRARSSSSTSEN